MAGEDLVELKFRLFDGTDIGPNKYNPTTTTIGALKEVILSQWPQDKENGPKTINDVKLINAGKILENHRSLAESRVPVAELPGGVITMHVVVQPPMFDKNNDAQTIRHEQEQRSAMQVQTQIDFLILLHVCDREIAGQFPKKQMQLLNPVSSHTMTREAFSVVSSDEYMCLDYIPYVIHSEPAVFASNWKQLQ